MSEKKFYCICDMGCKYETLNREQILTAITQAVSEGTIGDVDTGFVTTIKTINGKAVKFFFGTQSEYEALTDEEKTGLFAIITNDTSKEAFENAIEELRAEYDGLRESLAKGEFAANGLKITNITREYDAKLTESGYYLISVDGGSPNAGVSMGDYMCLVYWRQGYSVVTTAWHTGTETINLKIDGDGNISFIMILNNDPSTKTTMGNAICFAKIGE